MIYVYLSTVKWDLISASIRWGTGADWSHVGFYDSATGKTFSAMHDKMGVGWRDLDPKAKILLLEIPRADEALEAALKYTGCHYDVRDILGIILRRNWQSKGAFICDRLVFQSFVDIGAPLVNHRFIPPEHLTPRDVLLSEAIVSDRMLQS